MPRAARDRFVCACRAWNRSRELLDEAAVVRKHLRRWLRRAIALWRSVLPSNSGRPVRFAHERAAAYGRWRAVGPYERALRVLEESDFLLSPRPPIELQKRSRGRQHEPWKGWIRARLRKAGVPTRLGEQLLKATGLLERLRPLSIPMTFLATATVPSSPPPAKPRSPGHARRHRRHEAPGPGASRGARIQRA